MSEQNRLTLKIARMQAAVAIVTSYANIDKALVAEATAFLAKELSVAQNAD